MRRFPFKIDDITPTGERISERFISDPRLITDGNLVPDAAGRSFTFNGDDKQTEVRDTSTNALIGQYFYDGSGARVKKFVPGTGETTVFVYDAGGALAAEYSTIVAPVQEATTSYLTTDHLGSPRVITDASGGVIARRDFMPFGEELGVGVGSRTESLKYSNTDTDQIRQRFTGYEKDGETQLDFAEARMYQNKHGRFTAPDPLLASSSPANPQTFNRYTYTGNNPINYTDPSGLEWCQKADKTVKFTANTPCAKDQTDITGMTLMQSGYDGGLDSNGHRIDRGDYTTFHADGRAIVQTAAQYAAETGAEVRGTEQEIISTTAAEVSSNIAPRGALSLPCSAGTNCGTGSPLWSNPLSQGASAEEILDASQFVLDGIALSEFPVGSQVAGLISSGIDASRGNLSSAGLGILGMLPGGAAFDAAKITLRAGRLGNAATRSQVDEIAKYLIDRGYKIDRGGGLAAEEYLKPLFRGRKGGSYVDITATHTKTGKTIRINTVDTLKNGKTPTARERRNAARIRKQIGPKQHLLLVPKRK